MAFLDSSIFTAAKVWEASGHVSGFSDPMVVCNYCHTKFRADHLLEVIGVAADEKMTENRINAIFDEHRAKLHCPVCGKKILEKLSPRVCWRRPLLENLKTMTLKYICAEKRRREFL